MRIRAALPVIMMVLLLTNVSAGQQRTNVQQTMNQIQSDLASLDRSHQSYREASETLASLYSELNKKVDSVVKASSAVAPGKPDAAAVAGLQSAIREMQQAQAGFNRQYQQLQQKMQNENRQYTTVSNVLKTKHDTVKNSIGNVR